MLRGAYGAARPPRIENLCTPGTGDKAAPAAGAAAPPWLCMRTFHRSKAPPTRSLPDTCSSADAAAYPYPSKPFRRPFAAHSACLAQRRQKGWRQQRVRQSCRLGRGSRGAAALRSLHRPLPRFPG
eukprot:scaffold7402_cov220-Pinguiococcus_pyrenoidosus.AAC.2